MNSLPPRARLQQARELLQRRAIGEAEAMFEALLAEDPADAGALHYLGVAMQWSGRTARGVELIEQSIGLQPDDPTAYCNLSSGYLDLKRFEDAILCCDRALVLSPDLPELHVNRGLALAAMRRFDEAIVGYDRAIALRPGYFSASLHRAAAWLALRRLPEALEAYDRVLAIKPDHVEALNCRACLLCELNRPAEALIAIDLVIKVKPDFVDAHKNRGKILEDLQRHEEALAAYRAALALRPGHADAGNGVLTALIRLERFDEALEFGRSLLEQSPQDVTIISNVGCVLHNLRRFEEAIAYFDLGIKINPAYHINYSNRGNTLSELNRFDEAAVSWNKALELAPEFAEIHHNMAVHFANLGQNQQALASWDRAIAVSPGYPQAYFGKGLVHLVCGQFASGWDEYEWRREYLHSQDARNKLKSEWDGGAGKTVMLYWEQGLGDTIQFCRYAGMVRARGNKVILSVQDALLPLLKQLEPDIKVIGATEDEPPFDCACWLMSVPKLFGTDLETIPRAPHYLVSDPVRRGHFVALLPPKVRPRVGIAWRGNPEHKADRRRSIDLAVFLGLLNDDVEFVSLQKDLTSADAALLREDGRVIHLGGELNDFADSAALIDLMDMVITVDSSMAHLGGALGKPTWVLLAIVPDWRWLLAREDSPWYPSVRLFRQGGLDDWSGVIDRVARDLRDFAAIV